MDEWYFCLVLTPARGSDTTCKNYKPITRVMNQHFVKNLGWE